MRQLQARLLRVRITVGDWKRVLSPSVVKLSVGPGNVGIFLDPPYSTSAEVYVGTKNASISDDVLDWCLKADPDLRIVLAGYESDNDALLDVGWRKVESIGGQGSGFSKKGDAGRRERLWMSPSCLDPEGMLPLFGGGL
jgi:hypothetical protein